MGVFRGSRVKTNGGLTKDDLVVNKAGKVVSKKKYNLGKKIYKRGLNKWTKAFMQARKNLGLKGFVACKKGTKFYKEAMRIFKNWKEYKEKPKRKDDPLLCFVNPQ